MREITIVFLLTASLERKNVHRAPANWTLGGFTIAVFSADAGMTQDSFCSFSSKVSNFGGSERKRESSVFQQLSEIKTWHWVCLFVRGWIFLTSLLRAVIVRSISSSS
jgi:hypothetical protein